MSDRIYNFSAGPAVLPESVLRKTQEALWNLEGTGVGVMEHSHRGKAFTRVIEDAEATCRRVAGVPDNYRVLFLQGGASSQFFMVPMNLLKGGTADYIHTGAWSKKAIAEAKRYGTVHVAASSEEKKFAFIPGAQQTTYSERPVYVHYTSNNTIFGTQFRDAPQAPEGAALVCDASSDIFSRPIDVPAHGLIYAGAQKNLGPAGVCLVLIRDDLVEGGATDLPTMLQYRTHAKQGSLYNTPPTLAIYVVGEVLKWIEAEGGLGEMAKRNETKAGLLYDYLDQSSFFETTAEKESRSLMNVCFRAPTEELDAQLVASATERGLSGLKGHRSVGGMRASIYNAFPRDGVESLVRFLEAFESSHRAG